VLRIIVAPALNRFTHRLQSEPLKDEIILLSSELGYLEAYRHGLIDLFPRAGNIVAVDSGSSVVVVIVVVVVVVVIVVVIIVVIVIVVIVVVVVDIIVAVWFQFKIKVKVAGQFNNSLMPRACQ
jgi:Flp pilus assembly protein TadB